MRAPTPPAARDGLDRRPLVAHLLYRLDVGGLENILVELIRGLPDDAFRHAVICLADYDPAFRRRLPPGVPVYALHKPPGRGPGIYLRLGRLLRRLRPDLLHSCNLAALEGQPVAALCGVPARIHAEHGWDMGDLHGTRRKYRWLRRALSPWVHRHVTVSAHLAAYLTERVGIPASRVEHIYNGVDVHRFAAPAAQGAGEGESPFVIGTVGRLTPVKDQATLVAAFQRLRDLAPDRFPQARLVILGDGPKRAELQAALDGAGLAGQAWLPGSRADVDEQLQRLDLFVLPSLAEGIPVTVLEAMAAGVPVVATRVGGIPELVDDGVTGTLVPPGDTEALAKALRGYLEAPERGRREGAAGRERVVAHFSRERMVADYGGLYRTLLARVDTPAPGEGG